MSEAVVNIRFSLRFDDLARSIVPECFQGHRRATDRVHWCVEELYKRIMAERASTEALANGKEDRQVNAAAAVE